MRTQALARALALLASLIVVPLAAHAGDSTPPAITHTPAHATAGQPIHLAAHIVDESRIFPQLFFRYGTHGAYEAPIDLKKVKGAKDEYDATIPYKPGPIDYYIECYVEFGNGPARAGAPEAPLRVIVDEASAKIDMPLPAPGSPAPDSIVAAPAPMAVASDSAPADSAAAPTPVDAKPRETKAIVSTHLTQPAAQFTAREAAWHSAILPGWGQFRSDRKIRGVAFGVATGASLVATLWLTVRAHQANTIYVNAPLTVRSQAYDQAVHLADARNTLLGVTISLYALNIAEAYFFHGSKDP